MSNQSEKPNIDDVRNLLIEQLRSLRTAKPEMVETEVKRAKAMSEVAQTIVNSAKVEVEYLNSDIEGKSAFLNCDVSNIDRLSHKENLPNGVVAVTRHRLF
jgi:transcriptional antiterminator Rof (Rho-off)